MQKLGKIEAQFADMIWEKAPLPTSEMVRLSAEKFGWARTTTYTVLKRLCERGLFANENKTVVVKIGRDEFYSQQSKEYVDEAFGGSLPDFIAAFTAGKKLTKKEADKIRDMIDSFSEE